jgi:pimeloyl-ACP methyl ester carboxylesterase
MLWMTCREDGRDAGRARQRSTHQCPSAPRSGAPPVGLKWRVVLVFGVTLLAVACGGSGAGGESGQTPAAPTTTGGAIAKPCLQGAGAVPLRFTTSAGARLVGVVVGSGRTGLVVGHELGSDLCEWLPQAEALARQGYQVLALDFEGYGDSTPGTGPDARLDVDVVAAAAQLRQRGADRIVLVGSSMGGTAVLSAATRIRPLVAGVVSLSGPATFQGIDAGAAVARLRVPVLFVAAADDPGYVDDARAMYRKAKVADKRLLVAAGNAHGTLLLTAGSDAAKVRAVLDRFLADHTRR